jgi:ATP-binding cassette subfamily C (CFTR/MRP) protein 1
MSCPPGSDNQFGPHVNPLCRPFDFTLLFEDTIFTLLPAILFVLATAARLSVLIRAPVKVRSYSLAIWKIVCRFHLD